MNPSISMNNSPPAPSPSSAPQTGNDFTKGAVQMGQLYSQGLTAQPVLEPMPGQPGDNSNIEATPPGYPRKANSRAPQASAPGPRTANLNKLRGRK